MNYYRCPKCGSFLVEADSILMKCPASCRECGYSAESAEFVYEPTPEEREQYEGNVEHHMIVQKYLDFMSGSIVERAYTHDDSKFSREEFSTYTTVVPKLKGLQYGSDEYKATVKLLGPALKHHQSNNRHHPEYFENGISGMNLVDVIEMFCDWKAASLRGGGDFVKSLDISAERYNLDPQLLQIFKNTAPLLEVKNDSLSS